jgi:hypothetical protein
VGPVWNFGSDSTSVQIGQAMTSRARNRSSSARPYIWRFARSSLVICPSVCPFDHRPVSASRNRSQVGPDACAERGQQARFAVSHPTCQAAVLWVRVMGWKPL